MGPGSAQPVCVSAVTQAYCTCKEAALSTFFVGPRDIAQKRTPPQFPYQGGTCSPAVVLSDYVIVFKLGGSFSLQPYLHVSDYYEVKFLSHIVCHLDLFFEIPIYFSVSLIDL